MKNIKKIAEISLLGLLCFSTVYGGGSPKLRRRGKIFTTINQSVKRILRRRSINDKLDALRATSELSSTVSSKERIPFSKKRKSQGSSVKDAQKHDEQQVFPTTRRRLPVVGRAQVVDYSLLEGNTLSRTMQRKIALEARSYLDELDWVRTPQQPASYSVVQRGVDTLGNLTRMSEEQYAAGKKAFEDAVTYMQEVSKSINAEIYYLGTSEGEAFRPEQIRQRLGEILQGQNLVRDARAIWGDNYTLVRIAIYWERMQEVYNALGTGILSIGKEKLKTIKRSDGHVYVSEEFGLLSTITEVPLPEPDWRDPSAWLGLNMSGTVPARLRVAILQDDPKVINGLKMMRKRAGLKNWTLDFYDDPEAFLNQVSYEKYDMILTDVLIRNGGGRYLARQLRNRGYEGSILTLSGFEVTHGGEEFFNDGIDGMISIGWASDLSDLIWRRLNNYFLLKEKYGWKH